jgi:HEAT repeat protein
VLVAAQSPELQVRLAAFAALGELGDVTAIPLLAAAATSSNEAEQKAARQAMTELRRGPVGETMVAQLVSADPNVQVELIRALTARKDKSAAPKLLELARNDTGSARRAALRGLEQFADGSDLPALVQLLTLAEDETARAEVRRVFEALADRTSEGQKLDVTPIVQALAVANAETRIALLQVSAFFADPGLRAAFSAAIKGPDASVSKAAVRALCHTRDVELMPALLEQAGNADELTLRGLALEGYVRLARDQERLKVTAPQRVALLKKALALATRPEDKRLILAGLAAVPHPDALALTEQLSADATVKAEAEIAWLQIAKALIAAQPGLAEASLNRLATNASGNNVRTNAQALVKQFTSRWLCAGPYRQSGKSGRDLFDVAFAPEQPGLGAVTWRPVAGASDLSSAGIVELAGEAAGDNCIIYLKTRVFVPTAHAVSFQLGSDDGIKLWVNGEMTHANNIDRGVTPGEDRAKANLRQGWNDVLAKITQNGGGCGLSLRITATDGSEVAGLRYDPRGETRATRAN